MQAIENIPYKIGQSCGIASLTFAAMLLSNNMPLEKLTKHLIEQEQEHLCLQTALNARSLYVINAISLEIFNKVPHNQEHTQVRALAAHHAQWMAASDLIASLPIALNVDENFLKAAQTYL